MGHGSPLDAFLLRTWRKKPQMDHTVRRRGRLAPLVLIPAVFLAACGAGAGSASSGTDPAATEPAAATEVATATGAATGEAPERIVSLSPTATEILFAIGAGDQVVATDSLSTYPAEAPTTDLSAFEPNVEAIAEYDPDLVVTSYDPGDLVSGLDALSIATVLHPTAASLDDAYAQIEQLGAATGHVADAAELVAQIRSDLDAAVASAGEVPAGTTYYHEIDDTYYTVTSSTFIGEIYGLFGLTSIADAAEGAGEAGGYPQLSAEFIIESDPSIVLLASGATPADVAARPGWEGMTAVERGTVTEVDADITSRWGPRVVEFARSIAGQLEALQAAGASG